MLELFCASKITVSTSPPNSSSSPPIDASLESRTASPVQAAARQLLHTRSITLEAFRRDDGLLDIDASLVDVKPKDLALASGLRRAGEPVHQMHLTVTVDANFYVVDAIARTDAMPYPGVCDSIGPAYRKLIGLNLMDKFRRRVMERLGGTAGCTHLSELAGVIPTAAVQALAGQIKQDAKAQPFQLDRCHALRLDGPAVAKFYPAWARTPELDVFQGDVVADNAGSGARVDA
jgi:hypothetical protein